jgi:hypothetical protein
MPVGDRSAHFPAGSLMARSSLITSGAQLCRVRADD